ncbi:MAG: helix-turn-helix transcriptional regulator [Candidatus Limnocylindrales bacterium]|jgi:transcriptional regulator with XRE-family HTH domain
MSNADEAPARQAIREFLTSRRAKVGPREAGLPVYGANRRVSGLRREEVAMLAGISAEYYTRLERGNVRGVSEEVLDGIVRALHLDDAEREHLFDLVRVASAGAARPVRRSPAAERVRPSVKRIVDAMATIPAFVRNRRLDVLHANPLAEALYSELYRSPIRPVNSVRFAFLDPRAKQFYGDWETSAHDMVAALRSEAGRSPFDRSLTDLIGELSTRSEEFRVLWAGHDVRFHRSGVKTLHHPLVGDLTLAYEVLQLPGDSGQELVTYSAEPGSQTERSLAELAGWASTRDRFAALGAVDDR